MFKILGADGKEYGPITADVVRQWIADRRAAAHTKAQAAGSAEWKSLSQFPEFAAAFGPVPPPLPPTLPPAFPSKPASQPRTNGLAIASLVLGILGACSVGLTALVGLVMGIVSLTQIRRSPERFRGKGLAIAGICVSAFFVAVLLFVVPALLLPGLAKAKSSAATERCLNHVREVGLAIRLYADENDGLAPSAAEWCDAILPNLPEPESLQCPSQSSGRSSYGLNRRIAGRTLSSIPLDTVMIFETTGGWNVTGGPEDLPARPVHGRRYTIGFADGSARQVPPDELPTLRWEP